MLNHLRVDPDQAMLLVVDVQSALLPAIADHEDVTFQITQLLRGAKIFGIPVLATEQYPKGIGSTVPPVAELLAGLGEPILEKDTFSCCGEDPIRDALRRIDRPQVIVCGIEAHVCVLQTALDLVALGHQVFLCADAAGSRRRLDWELSLDRIRQAGAVVTSTESVLFELCVRCGTPQFKELLGLIKLGDARHQ